MILVKEIYIVALVISWQKSILAKIKSSEQLLAASNFWLNSSFVRLYCQVYMELQLAGISSYQGQNNTHALSHPVFLRRSLALEYYFFFFLPFLFGGGSLEFLLRDALTQYNKPSILNILYTRMSLACHKILLFVFM